MACYQTSCISELTNLDSYSDSLNINIPGSLPMGEFNYSFEDFLTEMDSSVNVESRDGNLVLVVEEKLNPQKAEDIISIDDQQFTDRISLNNSPFEVNEDTPLNIPEERFEFELNMEDDILLDSVWFKGGVMALEFEPISDLPLDANIVVYSLKDGERVHKENLRIETGESNQINIPLTYLTGVFENESQVKNRFTLGMALQGNIPANRTVGNILEFRVKLIDVQYKAVFGDFGHMAIDMGQTSFDIDLFGDELEGDMKFASPSITFNVENSFGFPFRLNFKDFSAQKNEEEYKLKGMALNQNTLVPRPMEFKGKSLHQIIIDNSNSNLKELLDVMPESFNVDASATVNDMEPFPHSNYLFDDSEAKVSVNMELPFDIAMRKFGFRDTVDFFSLDEKFTSRVKKALLEIRTKNEMPLSIGFQIFFLDKNMEVIDSVFTDPDINNKIGAAEVDQNGTVTSMMQEKAYVLLSDKLMDRLSDIHYYSMKLQMNTPSEMESVAFRNTDSLSIKVAIHADIDTGINVRDNINERM
ncbi:hypothetical protein AUTU_22670 [Aureibacter tunicatorum]|nr:hypothetical protein AUTU_22670 [Aureibacter tunicatorum]